MKTIFTFLFALLLMQSAYSQWQMMNSPNSTINDILILQDGKILAGSAAGLFISSDAGVSWDATLITTSVNHIKKDNFGNIYTSADYLYRSTDEGTTWEIPYNIDLDNPRNVQNIFINDSGYVFTIQSHGSPAIYSLCLKSTDYGNSWNIIGYRVFAGNATVSIGFSLIQNNFDILFFSHRLDTPPPGATSDKRILKKVPGLNYQTVLTNEIAYNMYLQNDDLYMATNSRGIIRSTDSGNTFTQLNNGLVNINVSQLILKPEVFIALTGDGINRSLDQGNWWVRLDHTGLTGTINRIYYDDNKTLYACTDNGIFIFTGELPVELLSFNVKAQTGRVSLNWSTASELNNQGFEVQRKSKNTEWITIGFKEGKGTTTERNDYTYSDDVTGINTGEVYYRLKQIDFDGTFTYSEEVKVGLIPFKYELFQNYPNPFNPTTTISWQSPVGSHQTLKVYDVLGNEVATLVNEYKDAGSYEVEFDASSLASGMYIYKLNAGSYTSSKKMLILK